MLQRIIEPIVRRRLATHGGVLIEGAKAVGKTTTALALCASSVRLDLDRAARAAGILDPELILDGDAPRLIDEFQLVPEAWGAVRARIDRSGAKGAFILTGSATPADEPTSHTGAGRMARVAMRTLTPVELGIASGRCSLKELLDGAPWSSDAHRLSVRESIDTMVTGGWPGHLGLRPLDALDAAQEYLKNIVEIDIERVTGVHRDPSGVMALLRGYARNVATQASMAAIAASGETSPSPASLRSYQSALQRLHLIEDQGAWSPQLRSRVRLAQAPKRHLADVSLAVAALGATPDRLLRDELEWTGFLFESWVVHALRVYSSGQRAQVLHYRDNKGLEVDAIVERPDGRWIGVEVKLGAARIDEGARNLLALREKLAPLAQERCAGLVVVAADTPSYRRPDGVQVASLASLGP